ncbi:perforin-1-like isoform X2 [Anguilla anguilla]|uniref:perforin-1-like isoform X2 n=1 Tax=Anguilla anguilla TaxID=7936 RepID=UPI0015B22160|nr:perforin-1-like isoform X2 [Anguilla anguilla]XP_035248302.1 perforin-1-like isoform X2 [Anguilla anguilla]
MTPRLFLWLLALGQMGAVLSCRVGTLEECQKASFVPGHNLAGEGFDIVKLQHKGAYVIDLQTFLDPSDSCTLCENTLHRDELQKLPLSVLDWRSFTSCRQELSSALLNTVTSVADSATDLIENDWTVGLDLGDLADLTVGGSHSNAVEFATAAYTMDKSVFTSHQLSCSHYSYRVSGNPPLSSEFRAQVRSLPQEYNPSTRHLYQRFISTYGTHYIQQVELGGRLKRLTSIRTCLASVNNHSATKVKDCLNTGLSVGLGFLEPSATTSQCRSLLENQDSQTGSQLSYLNHITEVLGGDKWLGEVSLFKNDSMAFRRWLTSLKDAPDIVSYSLFPLHELVPDPVVGGNVKTAVNQYLRENAIAKDEAPQQCFGQPNLSSDCCPLQPMRGRLRVTVIKAWGLDGDPVGSTDPYVKFWYGRHFQQTHWIKSEDNPRWNSAYDLGHVEAFHELKLEVWDKDVKYDDHLGTCRTRLQEGTHTVSCALSKGGFSYSYTLTCDSQLSGYQCAKYRPAPQ